MTYDEMTQAVADAKRVLTEADQAASDIAAMLIGRLRMVNNDYILKGLKRELRKYDMHRREWQD